MIKDLEQGIALAQEALDATPVDRPDRAVGLHDLGLHLNEMIERTGEINDLEQVVALLEAAVDTTPPDHPNRGLYLYSLAVSLGDRYLRTKRIADDVRSLELCKSALRHTLSPSSIRFRSGRRAIRTLCERGRWDESAEIAQTLFELLPSLCDRHMSRAYQQHVLRQVSGFAADACSISLKMKSPEEALQRIEFGRVLILGYLIDSRSDLSELVRVDPELAAEYERLRFQASQDTGDQEESVLREARMQDRRNASASMKNCEHSIRQKPGFEQFLLPASVEELQECASEGSIVVVNVTNISSDAIIVSKCSIEALTLPRMTLHPPQKFQNALQRHTDIEQREIVRDIQSDLQYQQSRDYLSWLWLVCVKPILQKVAELRSVEVFDIKPRVWWIGTGAASSCAFHAAGIHGRDLENSMESCLAMCISSYTPSIRSLKHARTAGSEPLRRNKSILVVTMPITPGMGTLSGAKIEGEAIRDVVGKTWTFKLQEHPTALQVLNEIPRSGIVHFACHGSSDPTNPLESHLILQKGNNIDKLTVSALLDANAGTQSWIAYLSACSTAEVRTKALSDESLHLNSAFQMIGFPHVIGSLRPANDEICVKVARYFYTSLFGLESTLKPNWTVAEALHCAIAQISREHPDHPEVWEPFIHVGI